MTAQEIISQLESLKGSRIDSINVITSIRK